MKRNNFLILGIILIFLGFPMFIFAQSASVSLEPLDLGIKQTVVSVTTSATALPTTALAGRKSLIIKNLSAGVVYLGLSTVTADTTATGGFQMAQNDIIAIDLGENTILYGIVASSTSNVSVLEAR